MKKLKTILFSLLLCLSVVFVTACGDKKAEVSSVSVQGLNQMYYITDEINFDDVKIKVNYSDKSTKTLTKGEFDIDAEDASAETEFVLTTNGLYQAVQDRQDNPLAEHDYTLTVTLMENNQQYELGTVKIVDDLSVSYDLLDFNMPTNFSDFYLAINNHEGLDEEAQFKDYSNTIMTVGDDNPIDISPVFTLKNKLNNQTENEGTMSLKLDVEVKQNGEVKGAESYTFENGMIDFADDARGEFSITVTPHDFASDTTKTYTLTVNVEDGYNVQHAYELGLLNMVDNNFGQPQDWFSSYGQSLMLFYDAQSSSYVKRNYYDVWRPFLQQKFEEDGTDASYIKQVNGIFLLNNLTVTTEDVPSDYFVTQAESEYAEGLYRDWAYLYHHFMTDNFSMNGNYFSISFDTFPLGGTQQDMNAQAHPYESYQDHHNKLEIGHSAAFAFIGPRNGGQYDGDKTAIIKNLDTAGNANKEEFLKTRQKEDIGELSNSLMFVRALATAVNMDNVIIKNYLISYSPEAYNNEEKEAVINNVKMYDSFSNMIYNYGAVTGGKLINCEMKRAGGPGILLIGAVAFNNSLGPTSITVGEGTVIESYIGKSLQEPWFNITGASALSTIITGLDEQIGSKTGKTIFKVQEGDTQEEKFNCICVQIDEKYIGSQQKVLKSKFNYKNEVFDTEAEEMTTNLYTQGATFKTTAELDTIYVLRLFDASYGANSPKMGIVLDLYNK